MFCRSGPRGGWIHCSSCRRLPTYLWASVWANCECQVHSNPIWFNYPASIWGSLFQCWALEWDSQCYAESKLFESWRKYTVRCNWELWASCAEATNAATKCSMEIHGTAICCVACVLSPAASEGKLFAASHVMICFRSAESNMLQSEQGSSCWWSGIIVKHGHGCHTEQLQLTLRYLTITLVTLLVCWNCLAESGSYLQYLVLGGQWCTGVFCSLVSTCYNLQNRFCLKDKMMSVKSKSLVFLECYEVL